MTPDLSRRIGDILGRANATPAEYAAMQRAVRDPKITRIDQLPQYGQDLYYQLETRAKANSVGPIPS